jgi:hypothetical protein
MSPLSDRSIRNQQHCGIINGMIHASDPRGQRLAVNWLQAFSALVLATCAYLLLAQRGALPPVFRLQQSLKVAISGPLDLAVLDDGLGISLRIGGDAAAMTAAAQSLGIYFNAQDIGSGRGLIRRKGASVSTRDGIITNFELDLSELAADTAAKRWVKVLNTLGIGTLAQSEDFDGHEAGETGIITQDFPETLNFDGVSFSPHYKLSFEQGRLTDIRGMLNAVL